MLETPETRPEVVNGIDWPTRRPDPGRRIICFMSRCMSWNWPSRSLTFGTVVPQPFATRRLRLPFRRRGSRRSSAVIELMIASMRRICLSVTSGCRSFVNLPIQGTISRSCVSGPIFSRCNCFWKSSRLNSPLTRRLVIFSALARSTFSPAFLIRLSISPMPRIREARSIRVEHLQGIHLFAHAEKLDRHPGDLADRDRRAAARIAVHLGQDQAGDRHPLVEALRNVHRFLTGHGIGNQQNLQPA